MSEPIWKCVYRCAQNITQQGMTPFTRADLINCVQRTYPHCGSDSINPIIQGLTDNLRGGALGAVGKDFLHSVGRGLFILKKDGISDIPSSKRGMARDPVVQAQSTKKPKVPVSVTATTGDKVLDINGYRFTFVCSIEPARNEDGAIQEIMPQNRYDNRRGLSLNKYGRGPFCKFKIPWNLFKPGVYAVVVERDVQYIGECENLSQRFNMGYGNISPRNCFVGGQETNCRLNQLILKEARKGITVSLWFHDTNEFKKLEARLRASSMFPWNRA